MQKKIHTLISVGNVCTFTTLDRQGKVNSKRTPTAGIDTDANLWFFTDDFTRAKHSGSQEVNFAHLMYAKSGKKNTYVRVCGNAVTVNNKEKFKEFWSPQMQEWFPLGLDDPKLSLVKVKTREVDYTHGPDNKIAAAFSALRTFLTGKKNDDEEKRNLTLNRM